MDRRVADVRRSAFEFVQGIERLSTTGEIMDAMDVLLKKHGCEYHCVTFLATATETLEDVLLSNRLPEGWLKLYVEKEYVHDDPAFRYAKTMVRPFRWFRESPYDPEREPRAAEVQRAADFGILDGFLIPVASAARRMGSNMVRRSDARSAGASVAGPTPHGDLCV
jgi:LuxR family transcriptional regulator, quorum-sensing system regulator BjaR1